MQTTIRNSLWFKLVTVFAVVTLLTLAVSFVIFYVISQGELARFLEKNSASVEQIVNQSQLVYPFEVDNSNVDPGSAPIIAITVPMETALQESTARGGIQFLGSIRRAVIIAVGFAVVMILAAGTLLFRQITLPLSRLENAAHAIGEGGMDVRVSVTTRDEVGRVGSSFNQMADKLQEQESIRRQMIADIAHELRTPLTVLQSNLEAMIDGLLTTDEKELGEVHEEVLRLIRLTEDLRLLSLADAGQLHLAVSSVNAGELIESILRQMAPAAQAKNIVLEGKIEGISKSILADPDKLKQALMNLVVNSIEYTPAGGQVFVCASQTQDEYNIIVADDGPGIPLADLPHVFERFWRGDRSRSRSGGGSGLGLAISQEIIHLHRGSITVDSPPTGGCTFRISLPQNN